MEKKTNKQTCKQTKRNLPENSHWGGITSVSKLENDILVRVKSSEGGGEGGRGRGLGEMSLLFCTYVSWPTAPASVTSNSNGQDPRVACAT